MGYESYYKVLNAKDYGVPQNRERVFTVSIRNDVAKNFHFPEPQPLMVRLREILEPVVDEKYYLSDEKINNMKITNFNSSSFNYRVKNPEDIANTLMARDYKDPQCIKVGDLDVKGQDCIKRVYSPEGLCPTLTTMGGGQREPKIISSQGGKSKGCVPSYRVRKLTPKEYWRLQGFSDDDFEKASKVNSNSQLYKQAGNSIPINVLEAIFNNLFKEEING